jgi:N6-L-threonylcarbamoyladenine synthase
MNRLYLGIDTSSYTTSVAVVDQAGNILADVRRVLKVKKGEKGLRQQEALFQHLENLSSLIESLDFDFRSIEAIGVSSRPRHEEGSYMPVFLAGLNCGKTLSKALRIPLRLFSHQDGHAACGLIDNTGLKKILCLHISGGTTELIEADNKDENLVTHIVGGTLDISIGQLVDRIGIRMGYQFPCGAAMDKDSIKGNKLPNDISIKINDGWINLSGVENKFAKLIEDNSLNRSDICCTLFCVTSHIIEEVISDRIKTIDYEKVLIMGGVAENTTVRDYLTSKFTHDKIVFARAGLSSDNAVGIAWLAGHKQGWEE